MFVNCVNTRFPLEMQSACDQPNGMKRTVNGTSERGT